MAGWAYQWRQGSLGHQGCVCADSYWWKGVTVEALRCDVNRGYCEYRDRTGEVFSQLSHRYNFDTSAVRKVCECWPLGF